MTLVSKVISENPQSRNSLGKQEDASVIVVEF